MLLRGTPILPDDRIQITAWREFRALSIEQLGEPLGSEGLATVQ